MSKNYHSLPGSSRQRPNGSQCNSCSTHSSVSSYTYNNARHKLTLASCLVKCYYFKLTFLTNYYLKQESGQQQQQGAAFLTKHDSGSARHEPKNKKSLLILANAN